jgi:hypothetical protein
MDLRSISENMANEQADVFTSYSHQTVGQP